MDSDIEIEVIRYGTFTTLIHLSNPKPCQHATTVLDVTCNSASIAHSTAPMHGSFVYDRQLMN